MVSAIFAFLVLLVSTVVPSIAQQTRYIGPFTNTTFNLSGIVVIDIAFAADGGASGYLNFTQNPNEVALCGAGDFTGTLQGSALALTFTSDDPDLGCGFDRGLIFTILATVSENADVIEGDYFISRGDQGVFTATRGRFPGPIGKSSVDGCAVTGDPVTLTNGNHFQHVEDVRLPGPGIPLRFARTYNSRSDRDGPLGFGWSHNFAVTLVRNADGTVSQLSGDGAQILFTPNADEAYVSTSPPGLFLTLTETEGGFALRHKDGLTLQFAPAAPDQPVKLTQIHDRNGNAQTLTYDGVSGALLAVTDSFGKSLTFGYENGRITSVTDMTGRIWTYAYDGNGNLASVTTPADAATPPATTAYTYYTHTYNAHNLEIIEDPRGNKRRFLYLPSDQLFREIDATGAEMTYAYDYAALQTRVTDPRGFERLYTYNDAGLVLSIQDADGAQTRFTWGPDANGPAGARTSVTNRLGRTTTLTYDASGNLTALTDPLGGITQFVYEPVFNQVTQITDPEGHVTTIGYDERGNPVTLTDPLGGVRTLTYDDRGLLLTQTDANGRTATFTYDARGQLETVIDAAGNVTRFTRDAVGNVTALTEGVGSPEERSSAFTYDLLGRLLSATDATGATTRFRYDLAGNLVEVENPAGQIIQRTYDDMNRVVHIEDPVSGVTRLTYDINGNLVRVIDGESQVTTFDYDARSQVVRITDDLGGETLFTYDALGNVVALQDARGQTTTFVYDALDRLIQRINPLGQSTAFAYDARSNLLMRTNPNGQVLSYAYDALSRLVGVATPDNAIALAYDGVGNVLAVDDNDSALRFTYDALNRLAMAQTLDTGVQPPVTLTHLYDAVGDRRELTDSANGVTRFAYDAADRLSQLVTPAGDAVSLAYDAAGRLEELLFPNGVHSTISYDTEGRLARLTHSAGETALRDFLYDRYDRLGNIRSIEELSQRRQFGYDDTQQLVSARTDASVDNYTYDAVGNRVTSSLSANYVHDVANRLLEDDQFTYTYDANGNLATKTAKSDAALTVYAYDAENRLIRIDFPDGTFAAYRYDGLGRRIEKNVNGVITRYVYDGEDILLEYDGGNALLARYSHGDRTDQPLSQERSGQRYFYHADHLGSIRIVTDAAGAEVSAYDYDGFGQLETAVEGVPNPYIFTGREQDVESGLYYYRARYYCPRTGRFVSEDPLGFAAGDVNLYRYVFNNPVNFRDPSGEILDTIADIGFIVFDLGKILVDNIVRECGNLGENLAALGADIVGAAIPGATGLGLVVRGRRASTIRRGQRGLPDDAFVCRGGTCTADRFAKGSGVTIDSQGRLSGVSVNSAPGKSVQGLTQSIPNKQVGVTTVGDVRKVGGDVIPSPTMGNPNHCTLCGITPKQAEELFTPTIRNPNIP